MTNKIYECSDEQFEKLIKGSINISEVLFKLGYTIKGNSWGFSLVKKRMIDLNLDYSDFKGKSAFKDRHNDRIEENNLFTKNSKHNRSVLRKYIVRHSLLPYKCAICGLSTWNNKTLSLELDHINGENNDNRLENLRFLCPNCHSQTTTYGARNCQKNESRYEITEELRELIENTYDRCKNIKKTSSILGVRRPIVARVVNESGQKHSNQRYVIRYDKDYKEIKRYGSLLEVARDLIANNEVKTKRPKTCTRAIVYNKNNFWLNSYWKILDGCGIINNPQLESSLMDSEDNVGEAQV